MAYICGRGWSKWSFESANTILRNGAGRNRRQTNYAIGEGDEKKCRIKFEGCSGRRGERTF